MMGQVMYFQCIVVLNGYEEFFFIKWYVDEICCFLEVLNICFEGCEWLVGDLYLIVDIVMYFWV